MSPFFFHQRLIDFPPQFIARAHTLSQVAISFVSEDVDISPNLKGRYLVRREEEEGRKNILLFEE